MSIKHLIFQNLKKNIKNYYLYVFALIFSVALYFSFVTLQYDPSMDRMKESVQGVATLQVSSILLVFIVAVFILYANSLFIKRRGNEIGLFQLIGMTKGQIFIILSAENLILYVGSLFTGIFFGFSVSKLLNMILLHMIDIETIAMLRFSSDALIQTVLVFAFIYILVMLMNYIIMKRQSILSLFQATSTTEGKGGKVSFLSMVIGIFGIGLIGLGYYLSSKLFSGDFPGYKLFLVMLAIVASIVIGTYFFYKGSVGFILHLIRKRKDGYLTLNNVLSLSSIMFRMKSNAMLLTIITVVSTLAISLLSLTYITYYDAEKMAEQMAPNHFSIFSGEDADKFITVLEENQIEYTENMIDISYMYIDMTDGLVPGTYEHLDLGDDPRSLLRVMSDQSFVNINVSEGETVLTKPHDILEQMLTFKDSGSIKFLGLKSEMTLEFSGLQDQYIFPQRLTAGFPVAIVTDDVYQQLAKDLDPSLQDEFSIYIGIDIQHSHQLEKANDIFLELGLAKWQGIWEGYESQLEVKDMQKQGVGLTMFIAGFLGLTFLITSGCILYFKQMDESEEEKPNYTILRKLGFTQEDLLNGIRMKQFFNFGIPLVLGLCHSYFAIKSGWFIFGSEMWTPMITVMVFYAILYSVFGFLSVQYYKRVIKEAL